MSGNKGGKTTNKPKLKQLSLFQITKGDANLKENEKQTQLQIDDATSLFCIQDADYSNMIDIWDLLPKYFLSNKQVDKIEFPWQQIRDARYQVTLKPTVRKNDSDSKTITGPIRVKFPGLREMYVEEALTKLAALNFRNSLEALEVELSDTNKQYLVSVKFTLYQLQKELKRVGHTYSINEIKEALTILNETTMSIKAVTRHPEYPDKEVFFEHRGPIISQLQLVGENSSLESGETLSRVVFHQLKTIGVMNVAFRKYNYEKSMRLSSYLPKYIYNRLITNWRQASVANEYSFRLNNFIEQSCREPSKTIHSDIRAMRNALNELIGKEVIESYSEEFIRENRKAVDVRFSLIPHSSFVRDTKIANSTQRHLHEILEKKNDERQPKLTSKEHLANMRNILKKKR